MEDKMQQLINGIKEKSKCSECGGKCTGTCTCVYCGKENIELKELIENLKKIMCVSDMETNKVNTLLTSFYQIKDINIPEIELILNNYEKTVINKFNELDNNYDLVIKGEYSFSREDYNLFIECLINKTIPVSKLEDKVINLCSKKMVEDKELFNIKEKEGLFKAFTEMISRDKIGSSRLRVEFIDDNYGCSGRYSDKLDKVELSRELLDKNPIEAYATVFHELTHQLQDRRIKDNIVSGLTIYNIMDKINREVIGNSYYDKNYNYLSGELEAHLVEFNEAINYFKSLNVEIPENIVEKRNAYSNYFLNYVNNTQFMYRNIDNNIYPIGYVFARCLYDNPNYLDKYPQIGLGYKKVDNHLIPKSTKELEKDYEDYKTGNINWNGEEKEIIELYERTIEYTKAFETYIENNTTETNYQENSKIKGYSSIIVMIFLNILLLVGTTLLFLVFNR